MVEFEYFSKSGKGFPELNEDNVFVNDQFGFVIDGATGYGNIKITEAETDAKWYSTVWKNYLVENLYDYSKSISEIMNSGLEHVIDRLNNYENYKKAEFPPSAAIAVFRIKEDKLEYFVLADCSLLIHFKDGSIKLISKDDIKEIDDRNMQLIISTAKEKNISILEAKKLPHIREVFVEMFKNRNTPTGGWVLSNSFLAIKHANVGELKLSDIKSILGFSDGFSQIFDLFKYMTPEQLSARIYKGEKFEKLYNLLYKLQQQDRDCNKYPRSKIRDDASAIKLIIA